jgi:actin related protein 2/3 complex subunit 2
MVLEERMLICCVDAKDDLIRRISLLKRNAMAAPFEQAFDEFHQLQEEASKYTSESAPQGIAEGGEVRAIHYREEEAIYVKASHDRVTVIFSTVFREETDRIFGKVFLQEFVDARRRAIQNAPQVLFRNDPPLELSHLPEVKSAQSGDIGYITFGTQPSTVQHNLKVELTHSSSFPSPFNKPAAGRGHFAHPDLPGLLPLPHQSIQSLYPLKNAEADSRLPQGYANSLNPHHYHTN